MVSRYVSPTRLTSSFESDSSTLQENKEVSYSQSSRVLDLKVTSSSSPNQHRLFELQRRLATPTKQVRESSFNMTRGEGGGGGKRLRYLNSKLEILAAPVASGSIGFEVYKFSEPPILAQQFFSETWLSSV